MLGVVLGLAISGAPNVPGCLGGAELIRRVEVIRRDGFSALTPRRVAADWPRGLKQTATDKLTGHPLELVRAGRVIDAIMHCGESYSFARQGGAEKAPLRAFTGLTVMPDEREARAFAKRIVIVVNPPSGSEASGYLAIDRPEPTRVLANYFWGGTTGRETLSVVQELRGDEQVVIVTWTLTTDESDE